MGHGGKLDFNNATQESLSSRLRDALQRGGVPMSEPQVQQSGTGVDVPWR